MLVAGCGDDPRPAPERELPAGDFLLTGVRIFDGTATVAADTVRVEAGMITEVGRGLPAGDLPVHDAAGATLLPGLIDAHVHASADGLRDALRFGVTTVLDMATNPDQLADLIPARHSTAPTDLADIWSAGHLITAPGGHGSQFGPVPTLAEGDDPAEFVADRLAEGSDYIKIIMEAGDAYEGITYVPLTTQQVHELIAAAHDHGVLTVVHIGSRSAAVDAVDAGADVLTHSPADGLLSADQIERLQATGVPMIATLSVSAASACGPEPERLTADPRVRPLLSKQQEDSFAWEPFACFPEVREPVFANTAALHEAGVPLLAGSDAPNPGTAAGATLLDELGLLVEVGLTPTEALTAATTAPAEVFGLTDRGRIAPGTRADLLLVDGDPTGDIDDIFEIAGLWKNGHPIDRTP